MEPQQLHHHRQLKYRVDRLSLQTKKVYSQIHVQNTYDAEAFSKHLAAETKYLSSLHTDERGEEHRAHRCYPSPSSYPNAASTCEPKVGANPEY